MKLTEHEAKMKFLAAEALRTVGCLAFFASSVGIVGKGDYVTGEMGKNML